MKAIKSVIDLLQLFPDEQSCIDYLEAIRWQNGNVTSPFDAESKVYKCKNNRYRCRNTGKYFNVKTGTLFDSSKIPLQKWLLAIWILTSHKKGISSLQLGKDLNVTQKTSWFMLHRIRNCFGTEKIPLLSNEVKIDETYVGGKNKNRHADKKVPNAQGRSNKDKTPILGMVERGGKIRAVKVKDVSKETLQKEVTQRVAEGATVYTDEWAGYSGLKKVYSHTYIKHNQGEYVRDRVHTNTIEGFWSLLKRGITGIYHSASKKHIQYYVDEFVYRYETRGIDEHQRFNMMLAESGKILRYKDLTAK